MAILKRYAGKKLKKSQFPASTAKVGLTSYPQTDMPIQPNNTGAKLQGNHISVTKQIVICPRRNDALLL
jgi:hypothetical protein